MEYTETPLKRKSEYELNSRKLQFTFTNNEEFSDEDCSIVDAPFSLLDKDMQDHSTSDSRSDKENSEEEYCSASESDFQESCTATSGKSVASKKSEERRSEELLLNSCCFKAGSVVYAFVVGYPWWPAIVDEDPDSKKYYWIESGVILLTSYPKHPLSNLFLILCFLDIETGLLSSSTLRSHIFPNSEVLLFSIGTSLHFFKAECLQETSTSAFMFSFTAS